MTDLLVPRPASTRPRPSLDPPYTWEPVDVDAMGTLTAAGADSAGGGDPWRGILTFEGLWTTDGREINGLNMRPLPLPLMAVDITTRGHMMARLAGRIDNIERQENGIIYGEGTYARTEWGAYVQGLVDQQMLRWDSVDLEILHWEWVLGGMDDDGWEEFKLRITEANVMGTTLVPFPAFARAVVVNGDGDLNLAGDQASVAAVGLGYPAPRPLAVVASGDAGPPPIELLSDQGLDRLTHTSVRDVPGTDLRHFAGHLADWNAPHIGIGNSTIYAPRSRSDYAYFRTGTTPVATADGTATVRTGVLSLGGGHANKRLGYRGATQHYDDASFGAGDLAVGEDRFGPWVSGVLRPETTFEQARVINATDISGDWRRIPALANLELVAILCVNVAGFPVVDRSLAASAATMADVVDFCAAFGRGAGGEEQVETLVAAGMVRGDPVSNHLLQLRRELSDLKALVEPLRGLALKELAAKITALGA